MQGFELASALLYASCCAVVVGSLAPWGRLGPSGLVREQCDYFYSCAQTVHPCAKLRAVARELSAVRGAALLRASGVLLHVARQHSAC